MKMFLSMTLAAGMVAIQAAEPRITGLAMSRAAEERNYTIEFTLEGGPAIVTLDIQTNVSGDVWASVGRGAMSGIYAETNHVRLAYGAIDCLVGITNIPIRCHWNPYADWPDTLLESGRIRAVANVWEKSAPPDFMAVDLTRANTVRFYESAAMLPGGITDGRYKTSELLMRKIPAKNVRWRMGTVGSPGASGGFGAQPEHYVTFTNDYYLAVYEFTCGQASNLFASVGTGSFSFKLTDYPDRYIRGMYKPIEGSFPHLRGKYTNADSVCVWPRDGHVVNTKSLIGRLRGFACNILFDMPTEAQWEYACRAGTSTRYYSGEETPESIGWYTASALHDVGELDSNAWNLYDTEGNMCEWCLDCWDEHGLSMTVDVTEPPGPAYSNQTQRVVRSCGYNWGINCTGSATRYRSDSWAGLRLWCPAEIP